MKWPSSQVRDSFIQYFVRHPSLPHLRVPSASVIPKNDPSLAFVNAGMNQFKDIILGMARPPKERVTNSQKCLRINDLELVGADTFHHTFFEMMGNWSFANYFKAEACQMAWDLLTNVYKLDANRLYVTYYAGGNGIEKDHETRKIWESIGVPKNRVIPFREENFWAMGPCGPCGPSTEIHYDHRGTLVDTSEVNTDGGNVVEIWNLVFMQYNRPVSGILERLPLTHVVDTGAGLERLTAVLNGKVSNYDTDLFLPIFDNVQYLSKIPKYGGRFDFNADLDRDYRIFADHMRAVTIALSDGILPQTNHKIRKLIQRCLEITGQRFLPHLKSSQDFASFMQESIKSVVSTLSKVYPETQQMKQETIEILQVEIDRFLDANNARIMDHQLLPNLLILNFPSIARIIKLELERVIAAGRLDGPTAHKWYESYGVTEEAAEELCDSLKVQFDKIGLLEETKRVKMGFRDEVARQTLLNSKANFTRKVEALLSSYNPKESGGICRPNLANSDGPFQIEWIFDEIGEPVEEVAGSEKKVWIILNKTVFIPGNPTLISDSGSISLEDGSRLEVHDVQLHPSGWILHRVSNIVPPGKIRRKATIIQFHPDNSKVFGRELTAQAIRYLQHWLYRHFKIVRYTGGFVSEQELRLIFTILKGDMGSNEIRQMQADLNENGIALVVTEKINKKNNEYELVCSTGVSAEVISRHGAEALELLNTLENLYSSQTDASDAVVQTEIASICYELARCLKDNNIKFPWDTYNLVKEGLEKARKLLQKIDEAGEIKRLAKEIEKSNSSSEAFVLQCLQSDNEFSSLKKLTRAVSNKPVLIIICSSDGYIQGRCSVPDEPSSTLSAAEWLSCITNEIRVGSVNAPKGQDPKLVANLKRVRVPDMQPKLDNAISKANEYIIHRMRGVQEGRTQINETVKQSV